MKRLGAFLCLLLALSASAAPLGLLVPAYFYPPTYWDGLNWAAARVPLAVIVNPGSGPGAAPDANYVAAVNNLRAAAGQALGYVYSSYAARDTNAIQADLTNFFNWYPLDGIFIDEMQNDANTNHYRYYAGLYGFIQTKGTNLWVMGNPGTTTQEPYLATVDALMTFENHATNYPSYVPDGWVTNHLARDFCHVVYAVTNATTMTNEINLAAGRNAGWVFVTDENDHAGNPYDRLPVYWTNEVNYVHSLNLAQVATQLKVLSVSNRVPNVQLTGAAGVYELQASTNLANWSVAATVAIPTNTLTVKDAGATNYSKRFYRTRQ